MVTKKMGKSSNLVLDFQMYFKFSLVFVMCSDFSVIFALFHDLVKYHSNIGIRTVKTVTK